MGKFYFIRKRINVNLRWISIEILRILDLPNCIKGIGKRGLKKNFYVVRFFIKIFRGRDKEGRKIKTYNNSYYCFGFVVWIKMYMIIFTDGFMVNFNSNLTLFLISKTLKTLVSPSESPDEGSLKLKRFNVDFHLQ